MEYNKLPPDDAPSTSRLSFDNIVNYRPPQKCVSTNKRRGTSELNSVNQPRGEYIAKDPKGIPPTPETGTLSYELHDTDEVYANKRITIIKV